VQTQFDALIVGAGPAGASAAILLASAGWSVGLIEKHAFPRRKVCGECVAASNLPLLDALGVGADAMARAGPDLRRVALMRRARIVEAALPAAASPWHAWGRAIARETLDTLLLARARAAGAVVLQPWAVQNVIGTTGRHRYAVCHTVSRQQAVLSAPVAIFAHGSWEHLPTERAAHRLTTGASALLAFKANFAGTTLAAGFLPILAFDGGYGGMVLADHGLATLACCIRADRLHALRRAMPGIPAGEVVEAMLKRECRGVAEALRGASRCGVWLASGPIAPGVRLRDDDQVFRIGNAAGEAHPIIGEGISMALQSAWLLCTDLVDSRKRQGTDSAAAWQADVHERYAARWRKMFTPRLRIASVFAHMAMRPAGSAALLALLSRWPALLTRGAVWSGKAESAVDAEAIGTHTTLSGRRAPHLN